ncbi:MAG: RNA 2',3'-cyclic phosphodiesterase [Candidatus Bipolaricaulota bacterium]|nr:RNA 2',3'-cyclic phosphodiesterase [Candidatus Bipolaricaulota bacterium]
MRLFFCVELPPPVRAELARLAARLRPRVRGAKWVEEENLHLTLRFLGEVGEDLLPGLQKLGEAAAGEAAPFELVLDRLGAFPSPSRARVLWAGTAGDAAPFVALAARLEEGVQRLGLPPEEKTAHPHVTLARLRIPGDLASLLGTTALTPLPVGLDALTLMESELRPEGPRYTPLARWPFRR